MLKGRVNFLELIDAPFDRVHELYRILFLKAEASAKAEEERKKKEEEERKRKEKEDIRAGRRGPIIQRDQPADEQPTTTSPLEAEAIEDVLEELAEGGVM